MSARRSFRNALTFLALALMFADATFATKKPPLHPVNLNIANAQELQQVPGIGPATADKILKMRKSYGPFKTVDDLRAIKGIGPKRLEKMRKYLTVGKTVPAQKPANSGSHAAVTNPTPHPSP